MRIRLENTSLLGDLVSFLRRCDCTVVILSDELLEVSPRDLAADPTLRQAELEMYLRVWNAMREDTHVQLLHREQTSA